MANLITDYKKLVSTLNLPEMHTGGCRREKPSDFNTSQAALDHLRDAGPTCGWLLFQSWQGAFTDGLPSIEDQWGNLLAAEAVLGNGDCLIAEHRSGAGWRIVRLKHDEDGDGFWDRVDHLTKQPAGGKLVYRRYWAANDMHGTVQVGTLLESILSDSGDHHVKR